MPTLAPVVEKWEDFGWQVVEINGHDMGEILRAFEHVRAIEDRPQMIVAHTLKGKGLSPFEQDDVNRKHGVALTEEEAQVALDELDEIKYTVAYASQQPELKPEDVHGELEV